MRKQLQIGLVVAALAWVPSTIVQAQQKSAVIVDATDPERLATVIRRLGYRAQVGTDSLGDPKITSSVGGLDFGIYFYGCSDHAACKSVLFQIGYNLTDGTTHEVVNDWNANKLFGRAYLDDENDPWLELSVNLDGGVTQANFEDTFDWWDVINGQFREHINF